MKEKQKYIKPLPFHWYFIPVVVAAMAGLADSTYLVYSHYRVYTDIGYKSFCAISKALNCDTVSQSAYSILWGVPVSVWGMIGYFFFLLLLFMAASKDACRQRLWPSLFMIALFFSFYSVALASISGYIIHSYCIMCIVSYVVNFTLLFYAWMIRRRFGAEGLIKGIKRDIAYLINKKELTLSVFIPFIAAVLVVFLFMPTYWELQPPPLSSDISTGVTRDGHPWIGGQAPELEIIEFSDYQCFQCKKMHFVLRRLIAEHPDRIRLVHKHYPMDSKFNTVIVPAPFHEGSGKLAMVGIYATIKGKFWEMNDLLYEVVHNADVLDIRWLAKQTGIPAKELAIAIRDRKIKQLLRRDIREGMKLEITGTPSYVINGKVYEGIIPPEILKKAME
ncbi:MAG: vitamin K epoxide reductase family protein [Thermodesulfobacteriota bacterium]|nr:vitamin K epoxide reductase family protein [Thermodesulfobacteriota bacterium]